MYKKYYQRFLNQNSGVQHYASHSHHYWPDVTREAMMQYWDDSAKYVDDKWNYIFSEKVPKTQKLIADILKLSNPQQIAFAPNTHELIYRLISCFDLAKPFRVLTTDAEFHSFERQIERLAEKNSVTVEKVATLPFHDFETRFIEIAKSQTYDLIFLSQVFFNSGLAVKNLKAIVDAVTNTDTIIVIDGYHGFMALPTDLSLIEDRIFYVAGSYKYAQGGEGCCFMHIPKNCQLRPEYTGWFAGFSELTNKSKQVSYPDSGMRFAGSSMEFSALYRLQAVLELFQREDITVESIHKHVQELQRNFLKALRDLNSPVLNEKDILKNDLSHHGHFFAFKLPTTELVERIHSHLKKNKLQTDFRADRLRFGFGLYQDQVIDLSAMRFFS